MSPLRQTDRLHRLHDQVLRKFELEQAQFVAQVKSEEEQLAELQRSMQEVEVMSREGQMRGWEALAWSEYRQDLEVKTDLKRSVLHDLQRVLQMAQERTLAAYQDAERWRRLAENAQLLERKERQKAVLRAADELAVTRQGDRDSGISKGLEAQ